LPGEIPSSARLLSKLARDTGKYIIGGSIPEKCSKGIYNTCFCFDKTGKLAATHRKVHLFDISIKGGITFKESDFLVSGESFTTFETDFAKFGIGICYDVRFPDYAQILAREYKVDCLVYPSAFNTVTGPLHWDILRKGRALDNQVYFAFCSPARNIDDATSYQAYGHSSVVNPWGKVLADTEHDETIVYSDIDLDEIEKCRSSIPCYAQRRTDLYQTSRIQ
jgi:omega-amidase